ncbi:MAG: heat-inducible transcriptional repressor HrcA, partial [Clostridia bacterium]
MQMDERKLRILRAIIDDYIMTAVPVGSRTISRKYDIGGLSSATIRNEMSDLEELGYLDQPHTSAGRIPSTKAYRLYAEQILSGAPKLEPEEIVQLRGYFDQRIQQVEGVIRSAAQAMADVTHYTTVVMAPQTRGMRIRHVQLVPVHENSALLVLVTDTGMVKEIMLHIDANLDPDHLYMISKMRTAQLAGRTLGEIRASLSQMARSMREHAGFFGQVLGALESTQQDVHPAEMVIGGS